MPFKRKIEIGIVKEDKNKPTAATDEVIIPVDYVQLARDTTETIAKYAAIGMAGYVLLDTFRQVVVKLTPEH